MQEENHGKKVTPTDQEKTRKRKYYKKPMFYNYICECGKNFSYQKHFDAHRRNVHNAPSIKSSSSNVLLKQCPLCDFCAIPRDEMMKHHETVHNVQFVEETHSFASQREFSLWKSKMESETKSKFIKKGSKTFPSHSNITFHCHRSGSYVAKGKGLRSLKFKGSIKMDGFCPAKILQKSMNDGSCTIKFLATHVGHQNKIEHLRLTQSEREELAKKLSMKVPFDEILDEVRDSKYDSSVRRIHLLNRKDLYNIEASYNLQSQSVRRRDDEQQGCTETNSNILIEAEEAESDSDTDESDSAICEFSNNIPSHQESQIVNERKEKLQTAMLETLGTISTIEEIEVMETKFAQVGPLLAAIRNKKASFQQNFIGSKIFISKRL